jgi:ankyrin repeat protein
VVSVTVANANSRLAEAVKNQNKEAVRDLLRQQVDVNTPEDDGATALHWAAHLSDLESADLLIRAGANANAKNDYGITPLSLACTNANAAMVEMLLKAGANSNTPIATGETPLMTCARTGSLDAVKALLSHGADVNAKEPSRDQTALMWAVAEHHSAVIRSLIEHGADIHARTKTPPRPASGGFTPLHFAAREGELEGARMLLAAGARVNDTAADGSTPLLVATIRGNVPIALFLLEQSADPNADGTGYIPLHWASGTWETQVSNPVFGFTDPMSGIPDRRAKLDLVKGLLAHHANPNAQAGRAPPRFGINHYQQSLVGATPFFLAAGNADVELMRILLDAGANPNTPTKDNTTALMAAAGLNLSQGERLVTEAAALEAVQLTLKLGGDAKAVNDGGENGLHGVAYLGWNRVLQLLVERGANVNTVSKRQLTPWLIASGYGDREVSNTVVRHKDTADLLLKLGADPKLGVPCEVQNCGIPKEEASGNPQSRRDR